MRIQLMLAIALFGVALGPSMAAPAERRATPGRQPSRGGKGGAGTWWATTAPAVSLDPVLGRGADQAWTVSANSYIVEPLAKSERLPAWADHLTHCIVPTAAKSIQLESRTKYPAGVEVRALVKLDPGSAKSTSFDLITARRDAPPPPEAPVPAAPSSPSTAPASQVKPAPPPRPRELFYRINITANRAKDNISAACFENSAPLHDLAALNQKLDWGAQNSNRFSYDLRAYDQYLPGWPEDFRAHIEADMASLPTLSEKWLPVRVELRKGLVRFWLDDRMVAWKRDDSIDPEGTVRLTLGTGARLAALTVLPIEDTRGFLPIRLGGYANGAALVGDATVDWSTMPAEDRLVDIGGVPFVFSGPQGDGRDHLDLSRSFLRQANSSGYLPSNSPRFIGAAQTDPARIQLRIPNGTYDALYLVAAADERENHVPLVTAMFYRPSAGFAESFNARVPIWSAQSTGDATPLPIKLSNGKSAKLWLVKIPLDPGRLSAFADLDVVEVELTKGVRLFRSYPDPINYGFHPAGLPSSVHVYAATLAPAPVEFTLNSEPFGHVWTAPSNPLYIATLTNRTDKAQAGTLTIETRSFDGKETTRTERPVNLPAPTPGRAAPFVRVQLPLPVKLFGYHDLTATLKIADKTWIEKRSLVKLAPDTRSPRWTEGRGAMFGYWSYHGGHHTPKPDHIVRLMTLAGARQTVHNPTNLGPEATALMEKHWGKGQAGAWEVSPQPWLAQDNPDPEKIKAWQADIIDKLKKFLEKQPEQFRHDQVYFYPEPHISSRLSAGNVPEYWGEKPYELTDDEKTRLKMFFNTSRLAAEAVRRDMPGMKLLIPWGDPGFIWPLLRAGFPKNLIDGVGIDVPGFERIPERQLHEQSPHRLYTLRKEFEKAGIPNPRLQYCEGIFVPTEPGAVSWSEQMNIYHRWALLSMAYGVDRFYSAWFAFDAGSYYGAEHYGGCGIQRRIPYCDPKPAYAAYATMTDKLNEASFDGWLKTGSLSTYCLRFKKADNKGFVYALWTLRGKRPVTLTVAEEGKVTGTDSMNNGVEIASKDKKVTVNTDPSVIYVTSTSAKQSIIAASVGEPINDDAGHPGDSVGTPTLVANLGDGSWKFTNERDTILETNHWAMMHYPGKFSAAVTNDATQGKVLTTKLEKQDAVRELMPWYNVLRPAKPMVLKGAPSHLGLWVKGNSDWGRFIYVLRDAKGERWTSIGAKDNYNCDDVHSWSQFNFDGWRLLQFELPGHTAWDSFRKHGTNWWRSDKGDDIVDLPLSLEAIIVEQRTHILYVNDVQPVAGDTVSFGKLLAFYWDGLDDPAEGPTNEAIRQSKLRMPLPTGTPDLPNPIATMARDNPLPAPTKLTKLVQPEHYYDGTRMHVHFEPASDAATTYLWVSAHKDGRGAVNLAPNGLKPGQLVRGLRPGIKLYYWLTYADADKKESKPSPVHEEVTVDNFKEK